MPCSRLALAWHSTRTNAYVWWCSGRGNAKDPLTTEGPHKDVHTRCWDSKKRVNAGAIVAWKVHDPDPRTAYEILGVQDDAEDDVIKLAFRRLVKRYHPDRNGERGSASRSAAEEKCKLLTKLGGWDGAGTSGATRFRAAAARVPGARWMDFWVSVSPPVRRRPQAA